MKICIVVPVYNESKEVGGIVRAIKARGLDVVVIDDGSTDGSGDIAAAEGAVIIRHGRKNGKGFALCKGFGYAVANGYDGAVSFDGDGQHAVEDIDSLVECAAQKGVDIVVGNRMEDPKGMPAGRLLTNRFMSWLISVPCGQRIPDTQCGLRLIKTHVLKSIELKCHAYEIETELLMKASKQGYKIQSVPIHTIYRDEESHIHPFRDTIRFFSYYFKELFSPSQKG